MSPVVPDRDGHYLTAEEQQKVGRVEANSRAWVIFWSLLPLIGVDFSDEINQQVEDAGGEAVVNLKPSAAVPGFPDMFPGILFMHWLPIWPGSVQVKVEGDIVKSARRVGDVSLGPESSPETLDEDGKPILRE